MPRQAKGPRLFLRQRKGRQPCWVILDTGCPEVSCRTDSREDAEKALADYIATKHRPGGPVEAGEMTISQALTIYAEDHAPTVADPARIAYAIDALEPFWGHLPVSAVKGATCRRYGAERDVKPATIRRELGVLNAALQFCASEGHLLSAPRATLPEAPPPKDRWLTRQEAAWLLRAARALNRDGQHLARFILVSLYTGTRKRATLGIRLDGPALHSGWVDLDRGVLYRQGSEERRTKKRQTPAKLPPRLLGHLRRWHANGDRFAVQTDNGRRVSDIKKGWNRARELAGEMAAARGIEIDLTDCTPHVLRHTCATWIMQGGPKIWAAAGYLGMSTETLERTYGHQHPDFQDSVIEALEFRRGQTA